MNDFIISSLEKLKNNNIPNAEIDLRVLLNYSKYSKNEIILSNFDLDQINIELFNKVLDRRLSKEPISKIINKKNFWKDEFYVNEFVLDPRPETEGIVEESIKLIKNKNSNIKILDIGTGTGCIAITLTKLIPSANTTAVDISKNALTVAESNSALNEVNVHFVISNVLELSSLENEFDIIVSNPPYVRNSEKIEIKNNVLKYEPDTALFVEDDDPLLFYRKIGKLSLDSLTNNGNLFFEINKACLAKFDGFS